MKGFIKPIVTKEEMNATWANTDKTPRVDAPRLKATPKKVAKPYVNHIARYKKLRRAVVEKKG
jgi:hypothetical protein